MRRDRNMVNLGVKRGEITRHRDDRAEEGQRCGWTATMLMGAYSVLGASVAPWVVLAMQGTGALRLPWRQRLGEGPRRRSASPVVWMHAASAGDVHAVVPIVEGLCAAIPGVQVVCSVQTRSGWLTAGKRLPASVMRVACPVDAWPWMDRFMARLRPDLIVVEYLELWPRLMASARRRGTPVVLTNARLHPRRRRAYRAGIAASVYRHMATQLCWATAQSVGDARALRDIGARTVRVVTHSKFATLGPPDVAQVDALARRHGLRHTARERMWLAAAVHADEFDVVLQAHARLLARQPDQVLVLCPRYLADSGRAVARARRWGLDVRRSDGRGPVREGGTVVVIDTVGELRALYALASVALIGGTLGARGGQNPLEAAIAGCDLLVGPSCVQIDALLTRLGVVPRPALATVAGLAEAVLASSSTANAAVQARAQEVVSYARADVAAVVAQLCAMLCGD